MVTVGFCGFVGVVECFDDGVVRDGFIGWARGDFGVSLGLVVVLYLESPVARCHCCIEPIISVSYAAFVHQTYYILYLRDAQTVRNVLPTTPGGCTTHLLVKLILCRHEFFHLPVYYRRSIEIPSGSVAHVPASEGIPLP